MSAHSCRSASMTWRADARHRLPGIPQPVALQLAGNRPECEEEPLKRIDAAQ